MKAVIYTDYGPPEVLKPAEIEKPVPKENEVLIRVRATSVNYGDLTARNFRTVTPRKFNMPFIFWLLTLFYFGAGKPRVKILGSEFAGEVESAGEKVRSFKPGDRVFGYRGQALGAYAQYLCMPENGVLATLPEGVSFEEAAVLPMGSIMARHLVGRGGVGPGKKVLINGASGSIGAAAVQFAVHAGAEVTGVCGAPRVDYVRSLGARRIIDYAREDFTRNGKTYDLIFDVLGKSSFSRCKNSLAPDGRYLRASFKMKELLQMFWTSLTGGKRVICALAPGGREDLLAVRELIAAGKLKTFIDRRFPLEQAAEAHRYVEEGSRKGPVAITVA